LNELLVFAKAPRMGFVKTRLAKDLGGEGALQAYRRLLKTVASRIDRIEGGTVCFSPAGSEQELRPYFPAHWSFWEQKGADLGERLRHALAASLGRGAGRIAVIGTDCPYLDSADIEQAWESLEFHDLVLGPANDGGYWLIGLKKLYPELFTEISWGTERVLDQTVAKASGLDLKVRLLRNLPDVDTVLDWQEFLGNSNLIGSER
jgi:rSAM/selenodomain-associated transferase 1